ncbi:WecB/TagA/CpsF family glycosyltransferase [Paratractidigestivibacter faecalis]|uniref:WecB/TagA/CpsF family glycosyltransferase n=1 Tax=Paratractidigestivibacter faecalis TaxID=2292441 RepID=UPI003F9D3B65
MAFYTDDKRYNFLDLPVDALTCDEALARVAELVRAGEPAHVLFLNVDVMVKADRNPRLKRAIERSALSLMDGKPPLRVAQKRGIPLPEKVSGSDFVPAVCAMAEREGLSVFILGGKEGVPETARDNLLAQHPSLGVVGVYSPKLGFETNPAELEKINEMLIEAGPDILLACLSCPKQEVFVEENRQVYRAPVSISCGATVDFLAGNVRRAPEWVSRAGIEWLYRFLKEPKRLFKRYFIDSWHFLKMCRKYPAN